LYDFRHFGDGLNPARWVRVSTKVSVRYRVLAIMTAAQIGGAVVQQGFGSLAPFVVSFFHITKAQLGLSFTAIMLGSAFTVAIGGMLVDRFGERNVTITAGIGVFLTLTIAALVPSYPWLVSWLFIMGFAYAAVTPAGGRAILTWFERDRGFAMSIRQMGVPAGAVVGGLVMPLLAARYGYQVGLFAGGLFALVLTSGAALLYRDPDTTGEPKTRFRDVLEGMRGLTRNRRAIYFTLLCAVMAIVQQTMNGFLTITAVQVGHTTIAVAAAVFAAAAVASMIGRISWGLVSDSLFHGDRIMPIATISLISTVASIGLALTQPGNVPLLFGSAILMGLSGSSWNGLFAAGMAEIGGVRFAGSAIGFGLTAVFAAGALGPVVFGVFADVRGLGLAWLGLGAFALFGFVPALLARRAFSLDASEGRQVTSG
jgi:ACS family hexuronate transporter-like MFS transporter